MPRRDITDPFLAGAGRRADRVEDVLRARIELLKRKLDDARGRIDLPAQIRRHPWPAIGIAFALGALAGRSARPRAPATADRPLAGAALTALGSLGLQIIRELAIVQLGETAKRWWTEHGGGSPDHARAAHAVEAE